MPTTLSFFASATTSTRELAPFGPPRPPARLDPAAFYARLGDAAADPDAAARLDPGERAHPVLRALSRRILVEVRDEYDLPLGESVRLQINNGAPADVTAERGA